MSNKSWKIRVPYIYINRLFSNPNDVEAAMRSKNNIGHFVRHPCMWILSILLPQEIRKVSNQMVFAVVSGCVCVLTLRSFELHILHDIWWFSPKSSYRNCQTCDHILLNCKLYIIILQLPVPVFLFFPVVQCFMWGENCNANYQYFTNFSGLEIPK